MSLEQDVWNTLSKIDVNQHTEKKGQFTYLSWSWAWATLKDNFPASTYTIEDDLIFPDGTMEVRIRVSVYDPESGEGISRS